MGEEETPADNGYNSQQAGLNSKLYLYFVDCTLNRFLIGCRVVWNDQEETLCGCSTARIYLCALTGEELLST